MPVHYGGVIYIYNHEYVRIQTPIGYNNLGVGSVIYTGKSPYWTGPNFQRSMQAYVRVRAWRGSSLPLPGYHQENISIDARSTDTSKVYIEKTHGLGKHPVYVKTRIHLTNGQYSGWVTDALGSTMIAYSVQEWWYRTIGVISAYDDFHVRVWVHSHQRVGVIFSTEDGWGSPYHMNPTTQGRVEIFAWKDFGYPALIKTSFDIGPGVANEQLEFPINKMTVDELFFDVMVEAKQGPNARFRFRGVGSAMTNTWNLNSVCGYGGLIYAYNNQSIRLWRPTSGYGGYTACIGNIFGNEQNSLAQENARVVITVWTLFPLTSSIVDPPVISCAYLSLLEVDSDLSTMPLAQYPSAETEYDCYNQCIKYQNCTIFSVGNGSCKLFPFPNLVEANQFPNLVETNQFPNLVEANQFSNRVEGNQFPSLVEANQFPNLVEANQFPNLVEANQFPNLVEANQFSNRVEANQFPNLVEANQFPNLVEANQFPNLVEANQFPNLVEANQFPNLVEANQFSNRVEANQFSNLVEANQFPNLVEANQFPNLVEANQIPNRVEANRFPNLVDSNQFPNLVEVNQFPNL
ncbi:hypothetical protein CHS0354_003617 [Potamilus streckersoni]|uniref:Uncharacterized protein n=1 Tax=Potamilus streckersoni TaxID=2493646 RepID=A0AAE0S995_9BIVA|nr:hypothetical protein CHS0354_003617 [Potamilus streckersoni]